MMPDPSFPPLFAQVAADAVSGPAGWVGTTLLSGVLYWLLFHHLPGKDKLAKETADAHAATVERLLDRSEKQQAAAQETFQQALAQVVNHCKEEAEQRDATFREEVAKLTAVVNKVLDATETRAQKGQ